MSSIPAIIMLLVTLSMLVYKDNYNGEGKLTDFFIEDATPGTGHILVNADPSDFTMDITNGAITGGVEGIIERNLSTPLLIEEAFPNYMGKGKSVHLYYKTFWHISYNISGYYCKVGDRACR